MNIQGRIVVHDKTVDAVPEVTKRKVLTRTERQQARTRGLLLDAGRTLVASKGVAGLRIQDITEKADIALGSFYNYFASKEELLEAIITESLSDLASAIVTAAKDDTDPAEAITLANLRIIRLAYDEPGFARLIVNIDRSDAVFRHAVYSHARVVVEQGIQSQRFIVQDTEVLLTALIGGAFALLRDILDGRHGEYGLQAFACHALTALGVPAPEAEAVVATVAARELS